MTVIEAPPRIRPGWVWGIFVYSLLAFVWVVVGQVMLVLGMYPASETQQAYIHRLTTVDILVGVVINALNLAAALTLWLLRKEAVILFVATLLFSVASSVWQVTQRGALDSLKQFGVLGKVVGLFGFGVAWGILVAICVYSWRLRKRGVLQ